MELTENILWLLKQAFYFSLTTVNEAVSSHGVSTAQIASATTRLRGKSNAVERQQPQLARTAETAEARR